MRAEKDRAIFLREGESFGGVDRSKGLKGKKEQRRIAVADKKIIAVVGATGAQGGGVCRAILSDKSGGYGVRALTRNSLSGKAKELKKLGAEVVTADVDDVESLKRAFHGAYGAFCVMFF